MKNKKVNNVDNEKLSGLLYTKNDDHLIVTNPVTKAQVGFTLINGENKTIDELKDYFKKDILNHNAFKYLDVKSYLTADDVDALDKIGFCYEKRVKIPSIYNNGTKNDVEYNGYLYFEEGEVGYYESKSGGIKNIIVTYSGDNENEPANLDDTIRLFFEDYEVKFPEEKIINKETN